MKTKLTINDVKILLDHGILVKEFLNGYFPNLPQVEVQVPYEKSKEKCLVAYLKLLGYKVDGLYGCTSWDGTEHFLLLKTRKPIGEEVRKLRLSKKYRYKDYIYISEKDRFRL